MRGTTRTAAVAGIAATALLAAACGGSDDPGTGTTQTGASGGAITVNGCNPQNPLVPGNTSETCGGNILEATVAGLVHYNTETAAPENDIAESIETTDNQNFTVKLVKGYKFSDGTEVKAKNFVDAWNYTSYGPNAQGASYFMDPIEGFGDLQCGTNAAGESDCKGAAPKAKELSGLKVVDDYTFTIKTSAAISNLPVRLGYTAFAPLPDIFFTDPVAFGDKPVAAGPFQVDEWVKNSEVKLSKFADYSGKYAGKLDSVTFKIIEDTDTAYNSVVGNELDLINAIPTSALIDDKYKTELPDRNLQRAGGRITVATFPSTKATKNYDNIKVRQAISMAIDRESIAKNIFSGSVDSADGFVSPVVDGYKEGQCGEYCTFDAAKAKALLAEAGGFPGDKITLGYNADGDHKAWTEATCNSIKDALGVPCVAVATPTFAEFLDLRQSQKITGMFRNGWQMDYPSIENFLTPIYATNASSNDSKYSNPKFDALLKKASGETSADAANASYQEAAQILVTDLPAVPLFFPKTTFGWSDKVTGVKITAFGTVDWSSIALK